ncbi:prolipoprotein diacylglyceryl transferase [bacterium]|nr:prolipoprotein diacylglyceryl transferase [bacterium]
MIQYPRIDPTIFSFDVGGFEVALRWYALMYILGYLFGTQIVKRRVLRNLFIIKIEDLENFVVHLIVGMLLGARVFYVIFYHPSYYLENPMDIPKIWMGGLSFHGAAVGMMVACARFAKTRGLPFYMATDALAYASCLGLFFGRMGNFINGELFGRASAVPWAMVFPTDPLQLPRHPSQLYQGLTEGLLLYLVLRIYQNWRIRRFSLHVGEVGGLFLLGYGVFRFLVEYTRQPDEQLGLLWGGFSMGQYLCFAMILGGLGVLLHTIKFMPLYKDPKLKI